MLTFEYRVTFEEWWEILTTVLCEHRVQFAVDQVYDQPQCEYHTRLTEELRKVIITNTRVVFLVGPAFSRNPLYLRQQSAGINKGKYFVDIVRGGPAMDLRMGARFEERGLSWFGEGAVGVQERYWNDTLTESYPAPQELRSAFADVKKTIQRHLLQKSIHGHVRWISPKVWELFQSGKAAFGLTGKCYTIDGEVPPPSPWQKKPIVR